MKEKNNNKKKKFKFRLPELTPLNMIILLLIIVFGFCIIAIPTLYITEYNSNKSKPFESDLESVDKSSIVYGNKNTIQDFNFVLYCSSYDNASGEIKFQTFAYENEKTRDIINLSTSQVEVKLGMYADWADVAQTTTAYKRYIASGPAVALGSTSRYRADFAIRNIPTLPLKGKLPLVTIKDIPVYAHVSYSTTINGSETKKHYILKYEYEDYIINSVSLPDGRQKEYQVDGSNIQWRYKNDTSWTTITTTANLTNIESRLSDGWIQWKRKGDADWSNLEITNTQGDVTITGDITKLTGYVEGTAPLVQTTSTYIQYKFPDQENWINLAAVSTLQSIQVKVEDNAIVWRRWNQNEFKTLMPINQLPEYSAEKVVSVRTSGSYIQYRYDTDNYINLHTVDTLIGVQVEVHDGKLQWKSKDETSWKDLTIDGVVLTEENIVKNPAKYGPTSGGIDNRGLNTGEIVAISISSVIVGLILCYVLLYFAFYRRNKLQYSFFHTIYYPLKKK